MWIALSLTGQLLVDCLNKDKKSLNRSSQLDGSSMSVSEDEELVEVVADAVQLLDGAKIDCCWNGPQWTSESCAAKETGNGNAGGVSGCAQHFVLACSDQDKYAHTAPPVLGKPRTTGTAALLDGIRSWAHSADHI
jgi:hypothetical protein